MCDDIDPERSFAWAGDNAIAVTAARERFNFYTARTATVRLPPLPYGTQRDVVICRDNRGRAVAAALCDGVHGDAGAYTANVPLQAVVQMVLAYPARPPTPAFSRHRRAIGFPKKVGAKTELAVATFLCFNGNVWCFQAMVRLMAGMATGSAEVAVTDVLWPPLSRAFHQLGGGEWHETATHVCGGFFTGGPVAAHFVARRQCRLHHGRLTIAIADALAALPHLFKAWTKRLLLLPLGQAVRQRQLGNVPRGLWPFFSGRIRRREAQELEARGAPPRCVRHALQMPATGPEPRAWRYDMRWDVAKVVRAYAALVGLSVAATVESAIVPAMRARGDSERAIAEFVAHTRSGKTTPFLCRHRTKPTGLFCPIGTAACAAERGIPHEPETMSPALVWATKAGKRRRVELRLE